MLSPVPDAPDTRDAQSAGRADLLCSVTVSSVSIGRARQYTAFSPLRAWGSEGDVSTLILRHDMDGCGYASLAMCSSSIMKNSPLRERPSSYTASVPT